MKPGVPVIDLFAGPGGLGEGFASLSDVFRIDLSAECEPSAHKTLRLRAFKRILERDSRSLDCYYDYVHGHTPVPFDDTCKDAWEVAGREALKLTLGDRHDNEVLARELEGLGLEQSNWVLIGGPPCQAYSIVGRARNRSKFDYVPEDDKRHFLYKEYLKIIQHFRPAVFVMENVKGMLSSRVGGQKIFHQILADLTRPDEALKRPRNGPGYRIHSLVDQSIVYRSGDEPGELSDDAFLVLSEYYGIPQTRHRVFLVGVREDIDSGPDELSFVSGAGGVGPTLHDAIGDLPALRSGLSRNDTEPAWREAVQDQGKRLIADAHRAGLDDIADAIAANLNDLSRRVPLSTGGIRFGGYPHKQSQDKWGLRRWWGDSRLESWLNHQARSHMPSDLGRYLYSSAFAQIWGRSPCGVDEFSLPGLAPNHANWSSGKFSDRFRAQPWGIPAKTITSHISKDGHYYIHPDPAQCRSLTVREAARVQTFPDNYFFEGNRTEQFHQVGNAVPPLLAHKIAHLVRDLLIEAGREIDDSQQDGMKPHSIQFG